MKFTTKIQILLYKILFFCTTVLTIIVRIDFAIIALKVLLSFFSSNRIVKSLKKSLVFEFLTFWPEKKVFLKFEIFCSFFPNFLFQDEDIIFAAVMTSVERKWLYNTNSWMVLWQCRQKRGGRFGFWRFLEYIIPLSMRHFCNKSII